MLLLAGAVTAPAAMAASVAEIVASPRTYSNRVMTISGVLVPGESWRLCAGPFTGPRDGKMYDTAACIDLEKTSAFEERPELYNGAIVSITGPYWHRCLEEVRAAEPELVREECKGEGTNGWIGPVRVRVTGYVKLDVEADSGAAPVDATSDPIGSGIDELAQQFVRAVRSGSMDDLVQLFPRYDRGRWRVYLQASGTEAHWRFRSREMTQLGRWAAVAGKGYKHFRSANGWNWTELCFCREDSCEGRWPVKSEDFVRPQNVTGPYVCHLTTADHGRWFLE